MATDTAGCTVQSVETYGDRRERERQTDTETQTETDRQRQRETERQTDRDRDTDRDTERHRHRQIQRETDRDFIYRRVADLKTVYIQPLPMREYLDQRDRQTDRVQNLNWQRAEQTRWQKRSGLLYVKLCSASRL